MDYIHVFGEDSPRGDGHQVAWLGRYRGLEWVEREVDATRPHVGELGGCRRELVDVVEESREGPGPYVGRNLECSNLNELSGGDDMPH